MGLLRILPIDTLVGSIRIANIYLIGLDVHLQRIGESFAGLHYDMARHRVSVLIPMLGRWLISAERFHDRLRQAQPWL